MCIRDRYGVDWAQLNMEPLTIAKNCVQIKLNKIIMEYGRDIPFPFITVKTGSAQLSASLVDNHILIA